MIHVCFSMTDKTGHYSKFIGTSMLSIFENVSNFSFLPSVTIHILHDNTLTDDNRDKFSYVAGQYNQLVKFYNVEELCVDRIKEIKTRFPRVVNARYSIATFYRFLIPYVLSEDIKKAIYLDADIIVNLDIKELWDVELGDKVLAVVPEKPMGSNVGSKALCIDGYVQYEDYFNAGVLLMNMTLLRAEKETIDNALVFLSENPQYSSFFDQDTLNYCFSARTIKLPIKFDRMTYLKREEETIAGEKIYHYATSTGLGLEQDDALNRLWMSYFIKTPWFDEEAIGRLYTGFLRIRKGLKNSALRLSSIVSGKSRGFFIEAHKINWLKRTYFVRDDEVIIPGENEESIQKLINAMKLLKGRFIFFIITIKFPIPKDFPFDLLVKEGFVEGVDFVKGWEYLNSPMKSYDLIKDM